MRSVCACAGVTNCWTHTAFVEAAAAAINCNDDGERRDARERVVDVDRQRYAASAVADAKQVTEARQVSRAWRRHVIVVGWRWCWRWCRC